MVTMYFYLSVDIHLYYYNKGLVFYQMILFVQFIIYSVVIYWVLSVYFNKKGMCVFCVSD